MAPRPRTKVRAGPEGDDDDDLLAQLGDLGADSVSGSNFSSRPPSSQSGSSSDPDSALSGVLVDDPLANLEILARSTPTPRTVTPRVSAEVPSRSNNNTNNTKSKANSGTGGTNARSSGSYSVPPGSVGAGRASGSAELGRVDEAGSEGPGLGGVLDGAKAGGGSGWWGGLIATATATASVVARTAEAAVKEVQQIDDAHRWTEQLRGNMNMDLLRGLGEEIKSRALPTLNTFINTIAPPISKHEVVRVHVWDEMVGYPSVERVVYNLFSRVMDQIEGGELVVFERSFGHGPGSGLESGPGITRKSFTGATGWSADGWWRTNDHPRTAIRRDFGAVAGRSEGLSRALASARSGAVEHFAARNMTLDQAVRAAIAAEGGDAGVEHVTDIFLAIQPTLLEGEEGEEGQGEEGESGQMAFAMYLYDPVHGIGFGTVSQPFSKRWADWLEYFPDGEPSGGSDGESGDGRAESDSGSYHPDIGPIIADGGIDPREWAAGWIEDAISLGVGVVAQRYVARRMGLDGGERGCG